jgi:hypothetical protein
VDADSVVRAFVTTLARLRREVPAGIPGAQSLRDVVYLGMRNEIPRDATVSGGIEYSVHGIGCRLTAADGTEVDVDVADDGSETFDAWRLWNFAGTLPGSGRPPQDELAAAAGRLVATGELREIRSGWYAAR